MIRSWMSALAVAALALAAGCAGSRAGPDMDEQVRLYEQAVPEPAAPAAHGPGWLRMGVLLAAASDETAAETAPAPLGDAASVPAMEYVPRQERIGPAYPHDPWRSVGRDVKELPLMVWDDTKHTFTDPVVWLGLLTAGAAGITLNATGVDDAIDRRTDGHRHLNSEWDGIGGFFGSPAVHFPLAGLMYAAGLWCEDTKLYETSKTLISALAINGLTTLALKVAVRTESPNGDEFGWPSGHTSSSFTLATVMYKAYGPWVGVPLFAFAGYVGYERIDARNHDFSDVISGMIIGIVIGHAVAENHKNKIFGMDLMPYVSPDGSAVGVALGKRF